MNIKDIQAGFRESIRRLFVKDRAPEEFKCPTCGCLLIWERMPFTGPWSGVVSCGKCSYREGVTKYLMDAILAVQPMQAVTVVDIEAVCKHVQGLVGNIPQYALSGSAAVIWLGGEKVTYDLDFIADGPLPIEPEETYENGYRYTILGRRVDWTVQADERKPLFMGLLDFGVYHNGVVVLPLECLLVLKCAAWTSRQKHVADIYYIRKTMEVDIETAIRLAEEFEVNPAHLKVSLETAARFSIDTLIKRESPKTHLTKEAYEAFVRKEEEENPGTMHPCDHWNAKECMCKGACGCHWEHAPVCTCGEDENKGPDKTLPHKTWCPKARE